MCMLWFFQNPESWSYDSDGVKSYVVVCFYESYSDFPFASIESKDRPARPTPSRTSLHLPSVKCRFWSGEKLTNKERMVETVYARTRHEGVMKQLEAVEAINAGITIGLWQLLWQFWNAKNLYTTRVKRVLFELLCDSFCDKTLDFDVWGAFEQKKEMIAA